jgi:DNA-binding Lrp family transcriptional regulator
MTAIQKEIEQLTKDLRFSQEDLWVRIRELLHEKGILAGTAVLAHSSPEDYQYEYGVVVTTDANVFEYGFDFLQKKISSGVFKEWKELTDRYQKSAYRERIEIALDLAGKENSAAE